MFYLFESDGSYEDREIQVVEFSDSREELELKCESFNRKIEDLQKLIDTEGRKLLEIRELRFQISLKENNIPSDEFRSFRKKWNAENPIPDNLKNCFDSDYNSCPVIRNVEDLYYAVAEVSRALAESL